MSQCQHDHVRCNDCGEGMTALTPPMTPRAEDREGVLRETLFDLFGWSTRAGAGRKDKDRALVWGDVDNPAWGRAAAKVRAALAAEDRSRVESRMDFVTQAQHVRAEHEATHGEAEQCGAECVVMGLTDDDEPEDRSRVEGRPGREDEAYAAGRLAGFEEGLEDRSRVEGEDPRLMALVRAGRVYVDGKVTLDADLFDDAWEALAERLAKVEPDHTEGESRGG